MNTLQVLEALLDWLTDASLAEMVTTFGLYNGQHQWNRFVKDGNFYRFYSRLDGDSRKQLAARLDLLNRLQEL